MADIPRPVLYKPHGLSDWVSRESSYTYAGNDTLRYDLSPQAVGGFTIVVESFRVDNLLNANTLTVNLGGRLLQVPPFTDFFNPAEKTAFLTVTGQTGNTVNIEIYGESFSASPYIGGRRAA